MVQFTITGADLAHDMHFTDVDVCMYVLDVAVFIFMRVVDLASGKVGSCLGWPFLANILLRTQGFFRFFNAR